MEQFEVAYDNLIDECKKSVEQVFKDYANIEIESTELPEESTPFSGDILGIVGFVSDTLEGSLVTVFDLDFLGEILEPIYGKRFSEINDSVRSGAAEFTNMIFGNLKTKLNKDGHSFRMAIPSTILGDEVEVLEVKGTDRKNICFLYKNFRFDIRITLQEK